jgi:shikimate 5-dehydrogenase
LKFEISSEQELESILSREELTSATITIPYKEVVTKYLAVSHGAAKELGVVNTVVKIQGKFHGNSLF